MTEGPGEYIAQNHPRFESYKDKYPHVRMDRTDGVLTLTLNSDGGPLIWTFEAHHELGYCFQEVGADPDNKVIVLTGTGDVFIDKVGPGYQGATPDAREWIFDHNEAKRLVMALVDIEQPIIAAVNGPIWGHGELPLLADIVIAADHAWLADRHFSVGLVPGDGVHVLLPLLLGFNRARYYMLTGKEISATELLDLGLIGEVVPLADLAARAQELARQLLKSPPSVVRLFRPTLMQHVKRLMVDGLSHGLMMEGMAALDHWPHGNGD
jgi:enoyl-CoA hydratase/carnithine racemase